MDDPSYEFRGNSGDEDAYDDLYSEPRVRKANRIRGEANRKERRSKRAKSRVERKPERVQSRDGTFRCRYCKTMVGVPLSGGKHRNHCPLCLHSRHVDERRPGDRASACRSLMHAIGLYTRRSGEQVLVHECLGCGVIRHNRVAADDNIVSTMRLPVLSGDAEGDVASENERSVS